MGGVARARAGPGLYGVTVRLVGIGLALVVLASCSSTASVKDLKTAKITLAINDEEFIAQDAIRTIELSLTSTSCLLLDPAVTARINGAGVPATGFGGTQEIGGVACTVPSWDSNLSFDGGDLTFTLSDSSGTATVTYVGGSEVRSVTPESSTLQGGVAARFDWLPASDQVTGVTASFESDGGTAWSTTTFAPTDAGFSFTPPSSGAGLGLLQLNATATAGGWECDWRSTRVSLRGTCLATAVV